MELNDYVRILRKFWVSIVAVTLLGLLAGAAMSLMATPTYTARSALFLTVQSADSASELAQGSTYTERQVRSFAEVAKTPVVLQPVIDALALGLTPASLAQRMTVAVPTNTSILELAVIDTEPERAAAIAQGLAESLVITVQRVAPKDAMGQATVEASIITPATVPTEWTSPRVAQNLVFGVAAGLLLGAGQALVRQTLDTRIRTADDVGRVTDIPVVGTVSFDPDAAEQPLVIADAPHSIRSEEYRRLRTNLQFLGVGTRGRSIAISSSVAGEGKSSTSVNVALALAAAGQRVLLMDADLRRPQVAAHFNLEGGVGLTSVLIGRAALADVIQPVGDHLDVLPAGQIPPNPSELLGSGAMRKLVADAGETYDHVLLDAAPLVPVADTAALSHAVGGVLIVVASGAVEAGQLNEAIESVQAVDGQVLGIVLNKVRGPDVRYRSAYYTTIDTEQAAPDETVAPAPAARAAL